tara:strand:- start:1843 stop:2652 length:810 start_codon:yes stop_codon:yes gene_type:complete
MSQNDTVTISDLIFSYQGKPIIDNLNLSIQKGSVVAIMGGSGVGKTTLLRLISGLMKPDSGKVLVMGNDLAKISNKKLLEVRKKLGFLFQFGALFTDLSCFENVAFPAREHLNLPEDLLRDLVLLKLETVGLRGAAGLMPAEISGGMARRVALARATVLDPDLILYDEPFAGLDPISLGITANLIKKLNDSLKATSIIVTHDVAETFAIADRVILLASRLAGAEIICEGNPSEIQKSKNEEVQQFIQGRLQGPVKFHYPAKNIEDFLRP